MDRQNSGDFFDPEGLMILLAAGPFTAPAMCLSIMVACGLAAASLPLAHSARTRKNSRPASAPRLMLIHNWPLSLV